MQKSEFNWKYSEGKSLAELEAYIKSTYKQHYAQGGQVQTLDLLDTLDLAEATCQTSILRYASRFGRKDGRNRKDLLKILHYTILWLHFMDKKQFSPGVSITEKD